MRSADKAKIGLGLKALVILIAIAGLSYSLHRVLSISAPSQEVVIGGTNVQVDVAKTFAERKKGLSGSDPLTGNEGMLFIFDSSEQHGFWMKDMKYSIDIIWIDDLLQVVHIENDVSPNTYPEVFYPDVPARYAVEVRAGFSDANGLELGDTVSLP